MLCIRIEMILGCLFTRNIQIILIHLKNMAARPGAKFFLCMIYILYSEDIS